MARKVYHSGPSDTGWKVTSAGRTISTHRTQRASEAAATAAGRKAEAKGGLGQAVLHKLNGRIREERSYG
jgi:tartrate dehydratase beta subunit/fumarate hydratase class I family protein